MSQEEIDNNFSFEKKKHQEFFLPYYQEKNWIVSKDNINGNTPISWDVRLEVFAGKFKLVDEKALRKEWKNCLVELIQCIKKKSWGWFYGEKDWVLYGSWNDISEIRPSSLYLIKMPELREYVYNLDGVLKTVISHKGFGITWNIALSWEDLINKSVAKKLI